MEHNILSIISRLISHFYLLWLYQPQVRVNYTRKNTSGFRIEGILLDVAGGGLSLIQLFIDSGLNNDWDAVTGDPAKLWVHIGVFHSLQQCLQSVLNQQESWLFRIMSFLSFKTEVYPLSRSSTISSSCSSITIYTQIGKSTSKHPFQLPTLTREQGCWTEKQEKSKLRILLDLFPSCVHTLWTFYCIECICMSYSSFVHRAIVHQFSFGNVWWARDR